MEKALADEERSLREDGLKHEENFVTYSLEGIRQMKNYDFFCRMQDNLWPSGDLSEEDYEVLYEREQVICDKLTHVMFSTMV